MFKIFKYNNQSIKVVKEGHSDKFFFTVLISQKLWVFHLLQSPKKTFHKYKKGGAMGSKGVFCGKTLNLKH